MCSDSKKDNVMICTICSDLYMLNSGDCGACPLYCIKCSESNDGLTCNKCKDRALQVSDGTCKRKCATQ